jgi:hypothetical protein
MKNKLQEIANDYESMLYSLESVTSEKIIGVAKQNGFVHDPEEYFFKKYGNGLILREGLHYVEKLDYEVERNGITIQVFNCSIVTDDDDEVETKQTVQIEYEN